MLKKDISHVPFLEAITVSLNNVESHPSIANIKNKTMSEYSSKMFTTL